MQSNSELKFQLGVDTAERASWFCSNDAALISYLNSPDVTWLDHSRPLSSEQGSKLMFKSEQLTGFSGGRLFLTTHWICRREAGGVAGLNPQTNWKGPGGVALISVDNVYRCALAQGT